MALGLLCTVASTARAQSREYRRLIRDAVAEFESENWAEARALFQSAHETFPNARTLRGMAMCAFELRDYDEAIELLQQALDSGVRPLNTRLREETEDLLRRARSFIGRFNVAVTPPEAELAIDDAPPVYNDYGQIVLPLGEHTFAASLDGYETEIRHVTVRGGEALEVSLALNSHRLPRRRACGLPTSSSSAS